MNADKLREALARAESLSGDMGTAADGLNSSFRDLEQALRTAGLRVPATVQLYTEHDEEECEPIGTTYLCWTKFKGTWSLTIFSDYCDGPRVDNSVVLTAASLHDRKVAANTVHELVAALVDALERQVNELEGAIGQVDAVTAIVLGEEL